MSEAGMRSQVVRALRSLDAVAVENPAHPGTPDVNCTLGWIELKWLRAWPKGAGTIVALPHFTQQQRIWLQRRHAAGGKVWLLFKVSRTWMLFDGPTAAKSVGKVSRAGCEFLATEQWNKLDPQEFIRCLQNN